MMAPYTIAHMKLGLKLSEINARLGQPDYQFEFEGRAHIYLTNTLEPASGFQTQDFADFFPALAHEAASLNSVKRTKRFTVVIGNPPYSASISEPEWLMRELEAWKHGLNETKIDLNREEWKFLRLAELLCAKVSMAVVGVIINRDFLDGIAKRRMREELQGTFPGRIIVDLNGDVKGNIADENVFEIAQGVCIALLCRGGRLQSHFFASLVGTRELKYELLTDKAAVDKQLRDFEPAPPFVRWVPFATAAAQDASADYEGWIPLDSVFTLKSSGIQTKNDPICIGWSADEVVDRVEKLSKLSAKDARLEFGLEGDGVWSLTAAQADLREFGVARKHIRRILYRPFDFRFTYYTHKSSGFLGRPRYDLMRHILAGSNVGLIFNRQIVGASVSHFSVSRDLMCHGTFYLGNKGHDYLAPLYVHNVDLLSDGANPGAPNFTSSFMAALRSKLGGAAARLTPEDIFYYAYGIFHSPNYRSRYAELLKIDFPRLPLTGNLQLFGALARLGGELVALHLLESPKLDHPITEYVGRRSPEVEKVSWSKNTVWVDKAQTIGFQGVRENLWSFHVGGYQVCESGSKTVEAANSPPTIAHTTKKSSSPFPKPSD